MLRRSREPNDMRAVVGEHRLAARDAQLQLRLGEPHPHQQVHHPRAVVIVRSNRAVVMNVELRSKWGVAGNIVLVEWASRSSK